MAQNQGYSLIVSDGLEALQLVNVPHVPHYSARQGEADDVGIPPDMATKSYSMALCACWSYHYTFSMFWS